MPSFSLDDIRAAADRKYGPTVIEVDGQSVRLVNPLRLSSAKRAALVAASERADDDERSTEDQIDSLRANLRIVAEHEWQADLLINAIGDDLGVLAEVFSSYSAEAELGEASPSAA